MFCITIEAASAVTYILSVHFFPQLKHNFPATKNFFHFSMVLYVRHASPQWLSLQNTQLGSCLLCIDAEVLPSPLEYQCFPLFVVSGGMSNCSSGLFLFSHFPRFLIRFSMPHCSHSSSIRTNPGLTWLSLRDLCVFLPSPVFAVHQSSSSVSHKNLMCFSNLGLVSQAI